MKILMELRPAFEGFAGIPQETRLLFSALHSKQNNIEVDGLLNTFNKAYFPRKPVGDARDLYEQARFIVSVVDSPRRDTWLQNLAYHADSAARYISFMVKNGIGSSLRLAPFDATSFYDFIWDRGFSKTLPAELLQKIIARSFYCLDNPGWNIMHLIGAATGAYARLDTREWDLAIMQTPFPGKLSSNTDLVIRYHDAIPLYFPQHIPHSRLHMLAHFRTLCMNAKSAWFACTSESVMNDLIRTVPESEPRALVIPDIVSDSLYHDPVPDPELKKIIRRYLEPSTMPKFETRKREEAFYDEHLFDSSFKFLISVSTIEPRKNYARVLSAAWDLFDQSDQTIKYIVVGSLGWKIAREHELMRQLAGRGGLFHLTGVPAKHLRKLYSGATATVCGSVAEGFDYSGVESMLCKAPVVASDIPAHRNVYLDAVIYFDPYSTKQLSEALLAMTTHANPDLTQKMIGMGTSLASRYRSEAIVPQWHNLFRRIKQHTL